MNPQRVAYYRPYLLDSRCWLKEMLTNLWFELLAFLQSNKRFLELFATQRWCRKCLASKTPDFKLRYLPSRQQPISSSVIKPIISFRKSFFRYRHLPHLNKHPFAKLPILLENRHILHLMHILLNELEAVPQPDNFLIKQHLFSTFFFISIVFIINNNLFHL